MALLDLTPEKLSQVIGQPVPDIYVVIAKNSVLDMDPESLSKLLGVTREELAEIESADLYKQVRLLVASAQAEGLAARDISWDSLEEAALAKLAKSIDRQADPDFLLRVAATANKAQRRVREHADRTLDPSTKEIRIPLRLTERIVQRINSGQVVEQERIREISVIDGSGVNPSFQEIDELMGLTAQPIPKPKLNQVSMPDDDVEDVMASAFLAALGKK